jgi:DNA-binding PadR family transcriptional regulator
MAIVGAAKRAILKELRKGRSHGYALAADLNLPLTGIYQHLQDLAREGLIQAHSEGRRKEYSLTPRGRKLVEALS